MASHSESVSTLTAQLPSGNHRLVCDDCGDVIIGTTEEEALDAPCSCHRRRRPVRYVYVYVLELVCALCSRTAGTVALPPPAARLVLLQPFRRPPGSAIAIATDAPQRHQMPEAPFVIAKPRRGRPPALLRRQRPLEESA